MNHTEMTRARELAAQAWCRPSTSHIVMYPELCEAFAQILARHMTPATPQPVTNPNKGSDTSPLGIAGMTDDQVRGALDTPAPGLKVSPQARPADPFDIEAVNTILGFHPIAGTVQWDLAVISWKRIRDSLKPQAPGEKAEAETARWQSAIHTLMAKECGREIDASGCDSGDPLDYTLSVIRRSIDEIREGGGAENGCEHGDHAAPAGKRFCSDACARCEHESSGESGCDNICGRASAPGEQAQDCICCTIAGANRPCPLHPAPPESNRGGDAREAHPEPKGRDNLRLAAQAVCDAATFGDCKSELSQQLNTTICKVPSKLIRGLEMALEALPPEPETAKPTARENPLLLEAMEYVRAFKAEETKDLPAVVGALSRFACHLMAWHERAREEIAAGAKPGAVDTPTPAPEPMDRGPDAAKRIAEYFYAMLPDGELKYTAADYLRDGILPPTPVATEREAGDDVR